MFKFRFVKTTLYAAAAFVFWQHRRHRQAPPPTYRQLRKKPLAIPHIASKRRRTSRGWETSSCLTRWLPRIKP